AQATGGASYTPAISAGGRYVAFHSNATNLVAGDSNAAADVFVKDTQTGAISRVSTDSLGAQATGGASYIPAISAGGRYVTFFSDATNLVAGDSNAAADVFVKDTQTGATTRVSTDSSGAQATGGSSYPAISADGRYVAFHSNATDLVAGDSNGVWDVFVKDTQTGATTRVSTDSLGAQATGGSSDPAISADGRYVTFHSDATNLVAGDSNGVWDVFVKDTQTGAISRASTDSLGAQATGGSSDPAISADGRYVAFHSDATNLVTGDSNGVADVFVTYTGARGAFTWYDNFGGANWVLMANPAGAAGDAWFDLSIAGANKILDPLPSHSPGQIPAGSTLAMRYPGLMGGPVYAGYHGNTKAFSSQRILWPSGGNSLEEVTDTDTKKLADHFWWTWYDQLSPGYTNWVLVANPGTDVISASVSFKNQADGLTVSATSDIAPGASWTPTFPGKMGGPVEVKAYRQGGDWNTAADRRQVMASQRVLSNYGAAFNEVPGMIASSGVHYWTWYDSQSPGARDWVLIANPDAFNTIYYLVELGNGGCNPDGTPSGLPNTACQTGSLPGGGNVTPIFPGVMNGPVTVKSYSDPARTSFTSSIASERSIWGPSFEEVPGIMDDATISPDYHWTWYDQQSAGALDWVLIANPDKTNDAWAVIKVNGVVRWEGPVAAGSRVYPQFNAVMAGPVEVLGYTNNTKTTMKSLIASQRVLWNGYFNEVLGTVLN
ncbi:MAG: TolB family protein, partial [Thermoleophilia bacterium]